MLEGYIFKDAVKNRVYVRTSPEPGAKKAVTRYRILASKGELSLVECKLVTGRTHQIRAQLAAAGCPLLGDGKYGRESINRKYGEKRQALCSYRLRFSFKSDADLLEYLNNREFRINNSPYFEKYFDLSKYC
jgi:23S rRNA pseudouridine955/2504/2580 synthase